MQHGHGVNDQSNAAPDTQSKDLWEHAYSNLKKRDPKLVLSFEKHIISGHISSMTATDPSLSAELIQTIAESKLTEQEANRWTIHFGGQSIKVREQWDNIIKFIFWAKDSISAAVGAQPYAALAWASVSILLPVGFEE